MIISDLYNINVKLSKYTTVLESTVTVTVTLMDFNKKAVTGKSVTLVCSDGYFSKNGNTVISNTTTKSISATTNSSGQITATYTASKTGLISFLINNDVKAELLVEDGVSFDNKVINVIETWHQTNDLPVQLEYEHRQTITGKGVTVKVYSNDFNVYIKYSGTAHELPSDTNYAFTTSIQDEYRPKIGYEYGLITHTPSSNVFGAVSSTGNVYIINRITASNWITSNGRYTIDFSVQGSITYPLKSRLP